MFLFVISIQPSFAETSPAFIKTELKKSEKIWQGQRQTLLITLYTTTSFSGSTRIELPEVSGIIIMESEDRPLLGTKNIEGVSYIFKQYEIILFPKRAGSLTVPPFSVEFAFWGPKNKVVWQIFSTSELTFTVEKIPGADPERPVITTTNLQVDDQWQPVPGKAKVGDAFSRIITMTAADFSGMAFPPLNIQTIEGVGLYSKQPQVADKMQRGGFTGKRIETISYICEQPGTFTVPEAQIQWWNPETESLQNILLEAVELKVGTNPILQKDSPVDRKVSGDAWGSWKWTMAVLLCLGIAGAAFIRHRRTMKQQSSQVIDKENELFKTFKEVSASHDAAATMQALLHWLDYSELTGSCGSLTRFIELAEDSELTLQVTALETTLYATGQKQHWVGDKLSSAVQRSRNKVKQHKSATVRYGLPPLNP